MTRIFRTVFHRRNLIISSLLFVLVGIQILVLMPRDAEPPDREEGSDLKASVKSNLPLGLNDRQSERTLTKRMGQTGAANRGDFQTGKGKASSNLAATNLSDAKAGQVVFDAKMVEAKAGGKELELWAARAMRPKESLEWTLQEVKVKFYASNGVTYTVTGKTGGVVTDTYAMWVKGNVITRSSNGYVFKTESMTYDPKLKKLNSPGAVEMTGPADAENSHLDLVGENLMADLNTNQLTITNRVRAHRRVYSLAAAGKTVEKVAQIQSSTALFSGKTNSAQFAGNVLIDIEAIRISGPRAEFSYDPKLGTLESVMVAGGVKVTDADKFATSGSLSVHFKEDRYVFKGSPRVVQKQDELVGDEIVILDGGKKVQVINARAQVDPEGPTQNKGLGR